MSIRLLVILLLISISTFSQITLKSSIKDANNKQPIPFPTIGITKDHSGIIGDANGYFEINAKEPSDTLKITAIGYQSTFVTINEASKLKEIFLHPESYELKEVIISSKDAAYKILGNNAYNKNICTAFIGENNNWRGEQAAIPILNPKGITYYIESFGFYIIKNEYTDSLQFRLMLYEANSYNYPGKTFLKRPILFKTNVKQGEVRIDLKDYNISTSGDFFISLECLEQKMDASKFCFAGSIKVPSYVKVTPFSKWTRVKGGGGDFNVKVSYSKSDKK